MNFNKNFKMEVKIRVSSKLITSLTTVNIYLVQKNKSRKKKINKKQKRTRTEHASTLNKALAFCDL